MNSLNPYGNKGPVSNPGQFWGRAAETARIFSRIGAGRPQSVSIIGEPGIGKTSMIRYLQAPEVKKTYLDTPEKVMVVGIEIPPEMREGPEQFMGLLKDLVSQETGVVVDGSRYEGFTNLINHPEISASKVILCLDDFHRITENRAYPMEFFSFLRSAANNYNVAFVTTSPLELQRLCVSRVVEESPFFNIFTNILLRPLSREEARKAVIEPSKAAERPLEPYADRIISWTGTAPDDLRAGCEILFERLGDSDTVGDKEWENFENHYMAEREHVFRKRWEGLSPELQVTLAGLVAGKKVDRSRMFAAAELSRKGYVGKETEGFPLLSGALARYVLSVSAKKASTASRRGGFVKKLLP